MFRARFVFLSHRYPLVSTNLSLESRVCTNECPDDGAYLSRGLRNFASVAAQYVRNLITYMPTIVL